MATDTQMSAQSHPAPHRERVEPLMLGFPVFAPVLAWSVHLLVNFSLSSHACYPGSMPLQSPAAGFGWIRIFLNVVDLVAMAICVGAVAVAWRSWKISGEELAETGSPLMEIGEGRTRFVAIWGVFIGAGFFIAIFFDFVGLWVLPICG